MAQKSKTEFLYTVLSHGFSKFLLKIIVSNSFKTLPKSDSSVLFFFFFFFVVWNWDKSNSQLSLKGYREYLHMIEWITLRKIFSPCFSIHFICYPSPHFGGWAQVAPEVILNELPPFESTTEKSLPLPYLGLLGQFQNFQKYTRAIYPKSPFQTWLLVPINH